MLTIPTGREAPSSGNIVRKIMFQYHHKMVEQTMTEIKKLVLDNPYMTVIADECKSTARKKLS